MKNLDKVKSLAKRELKSDPTGHDYLHVQRVADLSMRLVADDHDQVDYDVMLAASYLHDVIDEKLFKDHVEQQVEKVTQVLQNSGFSETEIGDILDIIQHMSFSKNIEHHYPLSKEGQYVQDADRLDALGAIGIARAFAYGGKHNQLIYNYNIKPQEITSHRQYRQHQATTFNHFYEKLFKLENLMNTAAGKKEAQQRTDFMKKFIAEFKNETN